MKCTVKSISQLAGVSPSTVSNVLRGKKSASEETVNRILQIAREMGYRGGMLSGSKIDTVCFVLFKKHGQVLADTPFFSALMEGIERSCRRFGCGLHVHNINVQDGDVREHVAEILALKNVGLILMATEMEAEDAMLFSSTQMPLVMLDGWLEDFCYPSVLINNSDAAYKAVKYLIDQGHRKIGYLRSEVPINNFYARSAGFRRAVEKFSLPYDKRFNCLSLPPSMDGSYRRMCEYLEDKPKLPSAFFADNDAIAIGAMKAMQEKGLRIPDDISVIGIDDMPYSRVSTPTLTTMRVFKEAMGEMAVRKLMDIARGDSPIPIKTQVGTKLIIRESVRKIL